MQQSMCLILTMLATRKVTPCVLDSEADFETDMLHLPGVMLPLEPS